MDQIYKTDLNELFSYQRKGEKLEEKEKVIEIEIERLRDFKEHPFHVKDDKEMSLLKESIKNYGILSPLIVRPVLDPSDGILHHEENIDLLPGNIELSALEVLMGNVMSRELILKDYIEMMRSRYDYIIIDCMPSLGIMTINSLVASDSVIIPVQAAYLPVKGLEQLIKTIHMVKKRLNRNLMIDGILLTMVDFRTNYAKDIALKLRETYGTKAFSLGSSSSLWILASTIAITASAEMMFSASRSRRLQIVPIIQSFSQLEKNYGKEGAEIIIDNTQLTIFGGFAPQSTSAETLSKALGSRTVMSGSVSRSKNDPSESLQMIERPLMTPDELKSMPKGQFVVMKTGFYPMKVKLKLFFKWGIQFDEKNPYAVADQGNRKVEYASKKDIMDGIVKKYRLDLLAPPEPADEGNASGGQDQAKDESSQPQTKKQQTRDKKKTGGSNLQTSPRARRTPPQEPKPEVSANGQT